MNYETRIDVNKAEPLSAELANAELGSGEELETPPRRRRMVLLVVGAMLAILAWLMLRPDPLPEAGAGAASQAPTVSVVVPGRASVEGTITATGTIDARREMPVGAVGEGGQVVRVLVDAGDWVREGQVLALIDPSVQNQQTASQAAQIQVAEADAELAQANLDRALKLVSRGFISQADVDRLTATRDAAVARVRVARAQLGELQARTDRLNIVAPAAGLILERNVEPGQVVGGSSGVLFRIARGGEMEMLAQVSEDDLAQLSLGQSATITPVGTATGLVGQIWQLSPTIDPQTRLGTARIALAYDASLRPGGFASAEIRSGTVVAPLLPESAILSDNSGSFVYVVGPDNKVVRRPVRTGLVTEDGIAVVEGLSGNERVVLRAGGFLTPGETVNPQATRL